MPGDDPKMIITDQDSAMAKAISQAFPHSFHTFCSWHVLNKFSERRNTLVYREYYKYFQKCIGESTTVEEFDAMCKDVINMAKLTENEWLEGVYEIRSKWVPAYVNHMFSAGMSSSQRAETNMHSSRGMYKKKLHCLILFFDLIEYFHDNVMRS